AAGIAPLLGVDLAVEPTDARPGSAPPWTGLRTPVRGGSSLGSAPPWTGLRTPVRGGSSVDLRRPRVTVLALARDDASGLPAGAGWGRLCRLVSATHLRGERGTPVASLELIAAHATVIAAPPDAIGTAPDGAAGVGGAAGMGSAAGMEEGPAALVVLLGPDSEFGRAALGRRPDLARAALARWRAALPPGSLAVEVVCHRGPQDSPASLGHAARMLALAAECGVPTVLTNAVRHATADGGATVDVLDAARRLVPLDDRHVDRVTSQGYLASPARMAHLAREITRAAGDESAAPDLLARTEALARRCRLDPSADVGLGTVHFPEAHVLGLTADEQPDAALRKRCEAGIGRCYPGADEHQLRVITDRLDAELTTISTLGYAAYFITVGQVCELIRDLGVRVAARGSGAGSLVNHLLGISGVDPIRYGLLMERFLTPLRAQLPDIDVDVESARRTEVYEAIIGEFGAERVTCVSMMDTYRVRHAIRDAGAALGMPPAEVDTIAKSFPHIRARDVRHAVAELPELRASGLASRHLDLLFDLVERLDGLPRHVALHPCGVVLSDAGLLDRTPVEASWLGFPMSQFDKDDVEEVGLLKLDVLGIRMQSAMAHALDEIVRLDGPDAGRAGGHPEGAPYLEVATGRIELDAVPHDDEATFRLIRTAHTLGCFQIESPGQRELVGKFAPETFGDIIIDISLFRPGPVKSDMVTPFLRARQGWDEPEYLHPSLEDVLRETCGVVVFHEQVLQLVSVTTGCGLAEADEIRRAMGSPEGQAEVETWWRPLAAARGYDPESVERIWAVLKAFASFGFCKAHAAAFAVPTYHSAWLKAHHPAAFFAGVLTHDPGMYPKRLILDDARNLGITVLPLDVNASEATYRVERIDGGTTGADGGLRAVPERPEEGLPDGRAYGIRLSLADVKGISDAEVARIIAGRPYHSLSDFWHRAQVSRPVVERLVVAGAFDSLHGLGVRLPVRRRHAVTRRDLLLQVAELDRWTRAVRPRSATGTGGSGRSVEAPAEMVLTGGAVRLAAARQSQAAQAVLPPQAHPVQLAMDLGDAPDEIVLSGLPEMTDAERVRAELEVLGLDASRHVMDFYLPLLEALGVTRARELLSRRSRAELLVAGVKVATQTPPVRSGRRVVFLTLDDATGPVDATFFEDAQGPYAATVFHSWLLVVRGELRRTGPRGVSLRATGAWELPLLWDTWTGEGIDAVWAIMAGADGAEEAAGTGRSRRQVRLPSAEFGGWLAEPTDHEVVAGLPTGDRSNRPDRSGGRATGAAPTGGSRAGGMGGAPVHRRVLVHP
ncbi:MAG TPA: DNA polymerase III subunit alpha, partial [Streptosporangiaceae bacterium]|nr:DNA polymerase III subunit alpha [Streptosporangiaceae bacterium]